jgi:hypothetical protein
MKQIAAILLLLSMLAQNFSRIFVLADYYANAAAYAKNCINKARPKMHCNGKCQMMKKLMLEEKKDQENTEKSENLKNQVLSSKSFFVSIDYPYASMLNASKNTAYLYYIPDEYLFDIFHPPKYSYCASNLGMDA